MKIQLLIILFLFSSQMLSAQNKFEQESKIKPRAAPQLAVDFIKDCGFSKRIKWYKEISQDGLTYEAKTKHLGSRYSIEFDEAGSCLDVEKEIKFSDIPNPIAQEIMNGVNAQFKKVKFTKIQFQTTGEQFRKYDLNQITIDDDEDWFYEIELKGKKGSEKKYYELLVNKAGVITQELEIIQRPLDNLEF